MPRLCPECRTVHCWHDHGQPGGDKLSPLAGCTATAAHEAAVAAIREAAGRRAARDLDPIPIRVKSAHGQPAPTTSIERTCRRCGASFRALAPGKTGERGLWSEAGWWCSIECYPGTP